MDSFIFLIKNGFKIIHWIYYLGLLVLVSCSSSDALSVYDLKCEYLKEPLGIDNPYCLDEPVNFKGFSPRISWKIAGKSKQGKQIAYRVVISKKRDGSQNKKTVWDSGIVEDSKQFCFVPDSIIQSGHSYYWKVGIYHRNLVSCTWSSSSRFTIGLLKKDWMGEWIEHPAVPEQSHIWFRKDFELREDVEISENVFVYIASAGYHELYVNGKKADDRVLAPAISRLDKRILYVTYDIGRFLKKGRNVIAINYGPGWSMNNYFASKIRQGILVQLRGDGDDTPILLSSDSSWKCRKGYSKNIGHFDFMDMGGELVDGRVFTDCWMDTDYDDGKWDYAIERTPDYPLILSSQMTNPSRIIETITAENITEIIDSAKPDSGREKIYRADMGKEFTGFLEARFSGLNYGDTVEIMVSMRDSAPEFVQATYGIGNKVIEEQKQKQIYIARGEDGEMFRNRFNFFAGRYIHFKGLRKAPVLQNIKGLVVSSAPEGTAAFNCSDSLYNRIFDLDRYTYQMCNTEGVTVDCPNRERLGYGPEGAYQTMWGLGLPCFNSSAYYIKNVRDWADVQSEDGYINNVAPQISVMYGCVLNGTAILNIAWEHYRMYGDKRILELAYPVGKKWLSFLNKYTKGEMLLPYDSGGYFLGEWVSPGPVFEYGGTEEALFFNNCAYAMTLDFMVRIARDLGYNSDSMENIKRLNILRQAMHRKYYNPRIGSYLNGDQVRTSFALFTGIVPDSLKIKVETYLLKKLEQQQYLNVGSFGRYPFYKTILSHSKYLNIVGNILTVTTYPGYGYFVEKECTTFPEMWEIDQPNSTLIHTSYTGVSALFIKGLAGINEGSCGYDTILIAPKLIEPLSRVIAETNTPYGKVKSAWEKDKSGKIKYTFTIPFGTVAKLRLDNENEKIVSAGDYCFYTSVDQ